MSDPNEIAAEHAYADAQGLAASGKYAEAIEAYSNALSRNPDHVRARCGRALALQRIAKHHDAIADFSDVTSRYPDWTGTFVAYYGRAVSRRALGQNVDAIKDCDEAIRRKVDLTDALYLRGVARKAIGQVEAAIDDMSEVLRLDPTYHEAYFVRGTLYCRQAQWEQAVADLTAAIEHGTANTENARACFYLRGVAAQERGTSGGDRRLYSGN